MSLNIIYIPFRQIVCKIPLWRYLSFITPCLFPNPNASVLSQYGSIFNLSLPKSWADLSDPHLLFFFRQLATDKPMAEIQTLCLCHWANILVRCRLYGSVYLVQHDKQQATLTLRQFVCAITALDFLKSFLHTPLPTHLCHWVLYPPHRWIPDTKHHRHREQHTFSQGQRIRWMEKLRHRQTLWRPWIKKRSVEGISSKKVVFLWQFFLKKLYFCGSSTMIK